VSEPQIIKSAAKITVQVVTCHHLVSLLGQQPCHEADKSSIAEISSLLQHRDQTCANLHDEWFMGWKGVAII